MSTQYFRFSTRRGIEPARSPLLERLLANADESTVVEDWRLEAFKVIAPQAEVMPGLSAVAFRTQAAGPAGAWVFFATPVHYVAEMSNVRLASTGILSLSQAEAESLAVDFNQVWHDDGVRLVAGRSADLFCAFDAPVPAATHDPEEVRGRHIEGFLPAGGADAARLRRLMSEVEMWLFDHAVNRTRVAGGRPPIVGLWLWGGGATVASLASIQGFSTGHDPFFGCLTGATSIADATSREGAGVVVLAEAPGTPGWRRAESRWIEPALAQLRAGRLARVAFSAGERCYGVRARWNLRFWRRRRPWWEYFT